MDNELYKRLITLIDGAITCVELFKAEYPAQEDWRARWLRDATQEIHNYRMFDIKKSIKSKLSEKEIKFLKDSGVNL